MVAGDARVKEEFIMRKFLLLALALTLVLTLAAPVMAAAPNGFVGGTVVAIDKNGYGSFDGTEITSNNCVKQFDNFSFVADNKALNAWYIDVTEDISGTLEVAYKISSNYFVVTFDIDGPGKYWIADSKGSSGANMAKVGAFVENEDWSWFLNVWVGWGVPGMSGPESSALFDEIKASGAFDFNMHLTNGYGDIVSGTAGYVGGMRSVPIRPNKIVDFRFDPAGGTFEYDGYVYTWEFDWLDGQADIGLNSTRDGLYYIPAIDGEEAIFWFKVTSEPIV